MVSATATTKLAAGVAVFFYMRLGHMMPTVHEQKTTALQLATATLQLSTTTLPSSSSASLSTSMLSACCVISYNLKAVARHEGEVSQLQPAILLGFHTPDTHERDTKRTVLFGARVHLRPHARAAVISTSHPKRSLLFTCRPFHFRPLVNKLP
jgi:hypothetical protein